MKATRSDAGTRRVLILISRQGTLFVLIFVQVGAWFRMGAECADIIPRAQIRVNCGGCCRVLILSPDGKGRDNFGLRWLLQ